MKPFLIVHVDDNSNHLDEVKGYIETHSDGEIDVVGFPVAMDALDYLSKNPDTPICLVDYDLRQSSTPGVSWTGLDFVRIAKLNSPNTNFIVLTQMPRTDAIMAEAAAAGCFGVASKMEAISGRRDANDLAAHRFITYLKYARYYSKRFLKYRSDARLSFSQSIAHSLRETLTGFRTQADQALAALKKTPPERAIAEAAPFIAELVSRIDRTEEAVKGVLGLYERPADTGYQRVEIGDVVEAAISSSRDKRGPEYGLTKNAIRYKRPAEPCEATVNPNLLTMAIDNLLHNAIKATDQLKGRERDICVEVSAYQPVDIPVEYLKIAVTDNGVGINDEIAENATQTHYRGGNLLKSLASFGIGCTEVEKIALLHRNGKFTGSFGLSNREDETGCHAVLHLPRHHRPNG